VATQSRQALVGLAVALLVISLRGDSETRRSKLILLTVAPILIVVGTLVRDQLASTNEFNSSLQRLNWFGDSMDVWRQQPFVGVGLRWWYTDRFPVAFQPPNAELEVLSSAGIVGLAAFLILMIGALRVVWRIDRLFGTLAFAVLLSRFVQGQLDIFWVSVSASLPFIVVGICLGAMAHASEDSARGPSLDAVRRRQVTHP
jgi:O-antigen ligase